jgi:hypothetical protein
MNREKKKREAVKSMEIIGVAADVIEDFQKNDNVKLSEYGNMFYYGNILPLTEQQKEFITAFEKRYNAVAYHVIHQYLSFGEVYNILYISDYPEEWEDALERLKENEVVAYVENLTNTECSEFGSIGICRLFNGSINRIW